MAVSMMSISNWCVFSEIDALYYYHTTFQTTSAMQIIASHYGESYQLSLKGPLVSGRTAAGALYGRSVERCRSLARYGWIKYSFAF